MDLLKSGSGVLLGLPGALPADGDKDVGMEAEGDGRCHHLSLCLQLSLHLG